MQTCDVTLTDEEQQMVRIDNRLADDPTHPSRADHPCGPGTIHLCTYEPDRDFIQLLHAKSPGTSEAVTIPIGPCDVIQLADTDRVIIRFHASDADGHVLGYRMRAHWKESNEFDVLGDGHLAADPDVLVGPTYADTPIGAQNVHRATLGAAEPEHDRPAWYGGSFRVTVPGSAFADSCAYTLIIRT